MAEFNFDDFPTADKVATAPAAVAPPPVPKERTPSKTTGFNFDDHPEVTDASTTQPTEEKSLGGKIVDGTGRVLDYPGGMSRTGLVGSPVGMSLDALQAYLRSKDAKDMASKMINRPDDAARALVGKAPRTEEYLTRAGVPEGPKLSDAVPYFDPGVGISALDALQAYLRSSNPSEIPGKMFTTGKGIPDALNPTARGAAGMVGDIVTDPLTYTGVSELAQGKNFLSKLLKGVSNPVGEGLEHAGEAYYKSGWKRPDAAAGDYMAAGSKTPSDVGLERGIWGTEKGLEQGKNAAVKELTAQKKALFPQFQNQELHPSDAWSQDLVDKLKTLKADPTTAEVADKALEQMAQYAEKGPVSPENIWLYQKNLTKKVAGSASNPGNGFKNIRSFDHYKEVEKQMARDLGNLLEGEAAKTSPELAEQFRSTNSDLSPLARSDRAMRSGAKNEANRKGLLSQIGAALLGGGIATAHGTGGASLIPAGLFYGAKAAGSPVARTGGGLMLNRAGQAVTNANLDALLRRGLVNSQDPGQSVWQNALQQNNQGGNQ